MENTIEEKENIENIAEAADTSEKIEVKNVEDLRKDAAELGQKAGELFVESAGLAATFISDRVKDAGAFFGKVNDGLHQTNEQKALEKYKPVFENDLADGNCQTPAILNIVSEYDKKSQSAFPDAIGFQQVINDKEKSEFAPGG